MRLFCSRPIEQPAKISGVGIYHPQELFTTEREAFTIPLRNKATWIELSERK
jgi:hypothetical protein